MENYRLASLIHFTVKPDATPEEVKAVVNDEQGGQIFSQAVCINIFHKSRKFKQLTHHPADELALY